MRRDPFARTELSKVRRYVADGTTCNWCGSLPRTRSGRTYLYKYTVEHDGGRKGEILGLFCSLSCLDSYQS
jgi:hypothetical protein